MKPMNLEVHIEELVLHGFAPSDRYRIGEAVERELGRMFSEQGLPPSLGKGGEVARLDGGAFEMGRDSKAEAIGIHMAQAVYRGLSR